MVPGKAPFETCCIKYMHLYLLLDLLYCRSLAFGLLLSNMAHSS